ncbi:YSIRK-type signal peptide-containing protein, partial [Staphylococcus capitis]
MNKYSIRRFSVGTASILVGTTLLFGIGNEAHAAEGDQTPNANENVADKDVSGTQLKEEAQNNEVTNEEPSKEEAQNNEVTNEEPSKEEATSNEVTSEEQPKEEA